MVLSWGFGSQTLFFPGAGGAVVVVRVVLVLAMGVVEVFSWFSVLDSKPLSSFCSRWSGTCDVLAGRGGMVAAAAVRLLMVLGGVVDAVSLLSETSALSVVVVERSRDSEVDFWVAGAAAATASTAD